MSAAIDYRIVVSALDDARRFMVAGVLLIPIAEAAAFTAGCAVLQAQAFHAERIGVALIVTIGILLLAFAILATPANLLDAAPFDDIAAWMSVPSPLPATPANHG